MQQDAKLSYTVDQAAKGIGLNRNAIYTLIAKGELKTFKVGRRRLVSAAALSDFIARKEREASTAGVAA